MVGLIYELKNKLLEEIDKDVSERGIERMDKEKVDMVKDLAEAEKECWEAEYYKSVTEAMENPSGYTQMPEYRDSRMGYRSGYRDSMGRYASRSRSGYHETMDELRNAMSTASPEEREKMRRELRTMLDM